MQLVKWQSLGFSAGPDLKVVRSSLAWGSVLSREGRREEEEEREGGREVGGGESIRGKETDRRCRSTWEHSKIQKNKLQNNDVLPWFSPTAGFFPPRSTHYFNKLQEQ